MCKSVDVEEEAGNLSTGSFPINSKIAMIACSCGNREAVDTEAASRPLRHRPNIT